MWRKKTKATSGLAALLLIGMAGCAELDVTNPNAPDAARALASSDDVEALIAGAYSNWIRTMHYSGFAAFASVMAFEHSAPWANFGMEYFGRIPRMPTANVAGGQSVGNLSYSWVRAYRAISAVRSGLAALEEGTVDLGDDNNRTLRAKAYGKLMQGITHGTLALVYDSAFIYDETMDAVLEELELKGYGEVMTAALGYLAEAATLAASGSFTVPDAWMSMDTDSDRIVEIAHSVAASYRANVARTPAERAAVDWNAVVADVNAGLTTDWENDADCSPSVFCMNGLRYRNRDGWSNLNQWYLGMADQSGGYQEWLATPTLNKLAFIIQTPDLRWPQGANEVEQLANPGVRYTMNTGSSRLWSRPDRGTWRWSYYYHTGPPYILDMVDDREAVIPLITVREMQLLRAEKAYRDGDMPTVATIVNETRVAVGGLNATDAAGLNTSCVPKLPNGDCGDLWEMFKWEKRLETRNVGPLQVGWWLDGRGWGDLMEGTMLHLPVPYREMQLLLESAYNLGGIGGTSSAPMGTYGY